MVCEIENTTNSAQLELGLGWAWQNLIFNFTENYQFSTRIKLNSEDVEELESTKLLGTIISNDLSWDLNTKNIVNKANARMELVRKVAGFGASNDDLKNIQIICVKSLQWE